MSENNTMNENQEYPFVVSVRFQNATKCYSFGTTDETLENGDYVVVETIRGVELAQVVGALIQSNESTLVAPLKPVLRKARKEDRDTYAENIELSKKSLSFCQKEVETLGLDMNLISAEYTLDRSKILIVYVADERVDFRELLKRLASQLHCRIELKQIGARDKAQMVGGVGVCGRELCCSSYMKNFDVISINMAKNQMLALNVSKLSGQCGKLMCCLKHEESTYKEQTRGLPKMNAKLNYMGHTYRVASINIYDEQVRLENREQSHTLSFEDARKLVIEKQKESKPQNEKTKKLPE